MTSHLDLVVHVFPLDPDALETIFSRLAHGCMYMMPILELRSYEFNNGPYVSMRKCSRPTRLTTTVAFEVVFSLPASTIQSFSHNLAICGRYVVIFTVGNLRPACSFRRFRHLNPCTFLMRIAPPLILAMYACKVECTVGV